MTTETIRSRNSTTVRASYPSSPPFSGLGWLERVAPRLTLELGEFLFFRPGKRFAALDLADAERVFDVEVRGTRMRVGGWGAGPAVVAAHGWAGGGNQFTALRKAIVEAGFSFFTFDLPAHGATGGRSSDVGEFADALLAVTRSLPNVHAVIGHSLGGTATCIALARGLSTNGVVLIAPMPSVEFAIGGFGSMLGLSEATRGRLEERAIRRAGLRSFERSLQALPAVSKPALLVHDQNDRMVPVAHSRAIARRWPRVTSLETTGRGHNRVLVDAQVAREVTHFLETLPAPVPAPLDRQLAALDAVDF